MAEQGKEGDATSALLPALRQRVPLLGGPLLRAAGVQRKGVSAEAHRQLTGHGYSQEAVTGKWKCDRCKAKGKVKVRK